MSNLSHHFSDQVFLKSISIKRIRVLAGPALPGDQEAILPEKPVPVCGLTPRMTFRPGAISSPRYRSS